MNECRLTVCALVVHFCASLACPHVQHASYIELVVLSFSRGAGLNRCTASPIDAQTEDERKSALRKSSRRVVSGDPRAARRLYVAEQKFIMVVAAIQAVFVAWAVLLTVTAGTQPLIAGAYFRV